LVVAVVAAGAPLDAADQTADGNAASPMAVRSTNPLVSALVADGYARSSTFKRIVDTIGRTDGIVYIVAAPCPARAMRGCLLHTMHATRQARYLWILIRMDYSRSRVIATIAHELQHAAEVLQHHPDIRSAVAMRSFYSSGEAGPSGVLQAWDSRSFETVAAIDVGDAVEAELQAGSHAVAADDSDGRE
jgi:hypothetical protein